MRVAGKWMSHSASGLAIQTAWMRDVGLPVGGVGEWSVLAGMWVSHLASGPATQTAWMRVAGKWMSH